MEYTREFILFKLGDQLISKRYGFDKLSQAKLSEISGVSRNSIYLIENGKVDPTIITMRKLAHALGYNMSEFFNFSMFDKEKDIQINNPNERF